MSIDFNKLYNPDKEKITSDTSEIDEILELNEIYYVISKKIIEYREENNLTQKELADIINVNQTMISKLESGNYNPTLKLIHKISRKLMNSADFFKETLKEIVQNLDNVQNIEFTTEIENRINISSTYSKINKKNIINFEEYYNKGENNYEEYQSKNAIFG